MTQRIAVLGVILIALCVSDAIAGPPEWAPRVDEKDWEAKDTIALPVWLRLGACFGEYERGEEEEWPDSGRQFPPMDLSGVQFQISIIPLTFNLNENTSVAADLPLLLAAHYMREKKREEKGTHDEWLLVGQLIPGLRLFASVSPHMAVSPYVGVGGGAVRDVGGSDEFDMVLSARLGCDLLFRDRLGVGLGLIVSDAGEDDYSHVTISFAIRP